MGGFGMTVATLLLVAVSSAVSAILSLPGTVRSLLRGERRIQIQDKPVRRVCVIGAGASGLITTKVLREREDWEVVTYEGSSRVGGMWAWGAGEDCPSTYNMARHYDSLTSNLSRVVMGLSDYQMDPELYPEAMVGHMQVDTFLAAYARDFNVLESVRLNHTVVQVRKEEDGQWEVEVEAGEEGRQLCRFDAVIVCTGHYGKPFVPDVEGLDSFPGTVMHSQQFESPTVGSSFAGKRVLVVGCGPSGGEQAAEVAELAEATMVSTRRGFVPIPKVDPKTGKPWDYSRSRLATYLPAWLGMYLARRYVFLPLLAAMRKMGVAAPKDSDLDNPKYLTVTVTQGLWRKLKSGEVQSNVGGIRHVSGNTVHFLDGGSFEADTILFCSGYSWEFPFLAQQKDVGSSVEETMGKELPVPVVRNRTRVDPLYRQVFFCNDPTMAFVGNPVGVFIFPMCEMQARWISAFLCGAAPLPCREDMVAERKKELEVMCKGVDAELALSKANKTSQAGYVDGIAKRLGLFPSPLRHWRLAEELVHGPICAAGYRLNDAVGQEYEKLASQLRSYKHVTKKKTT